MRSPLGLVRTKTGRVACVVSVVLLVTLASMPAEAGSCSSEETRFVQVSAIPFTYGSWNNIKVQDHDITGCSQLLNFFATARITNAGGDK